MLSINSQFKEVGNMNKNAHKCLKACTSCFWLFFWPWECKPSKHYSKITPINIWEFLLQERGQINPITIVVLLGLHDRFKEKGQGRSQRAKGAARGPGAAQVVVVLDFLKRTAGIHWNTGGSLFLNTNIFEKKNVKTINNLS